MPQTICFPGPISKTMLDELGQYVIATPYPFVLNLEKCEGMWLETVDGQRLFDWAGYFGSKLIGHNHPGLYEPEYIKALTLAANNKVANPDFLTPQCLEYYRLLYRLAPEIMKGDSLEIYAVNSGAEAVENVMKYLIAKFNERGGNQRHRRFLYFENAFHGRTIFALGVTQTIDPVATKDFHGLHTGGNLKLPFPSYNGDLSDEENLASAKKSLEQVEMLFSQMPGEFVGVIVEPIQGAGGHRIAVPEFFQGLSELCHKYNVYLAFDEVQTGLGATGKMWALDHFDLPYPPMAVASGKKFGTGVVYMLEPLSDIGVLDSTWGGTLADMVRVVQEMKIVERENLIPEAARKGDLLAGGLRQVVAKHSKIANNVRGLGIYQGFSLVSAELKSALVQTALHDHHLLLLGAGHRSIRTRPNLSVTDQDISHFLDLLDTTLEQIAG